MLGPAVIVVILGLALKLRVYQFDAYYVLQVRHLLCLLALCCLLVHVLDYRVLLCPACCDVASLLCWTCVRVHEHDAHSLAACYALLQSLPFHGSSPSTTR